MIVPIRRSLLVGIASAIAGRHRVRVHCSRSCTGVSVTPDHIDRAVGRRRRNGCHRAHHRQPARKRAGAAGQRCQPHRRQRRRRPRSDRFRAARWIHDRPGYRRDRHDALARADRADRCVVYAARARQRGPGRHSGARRCAVQDRSRLCWLRSRPTPASSKHRAPVRVASGISRSRACCAIRRSIRRRFRGCRAMAPRRDCRTWSPVASTSRRCRCPKHAR